MCRVLGQLGPLATRRFMSSGGRLHSLVPASFETQSKFLAQVVLDAQEQRVVQVVTSFRGNRKSTCARAMASKEPLLTKMFGTCEIPLVSVVRDLPATTSGFALADGLLGEAQHFEETKETAVKARRMIKLAQLLKKYLPQLLPESWDVEKTTSTLGRATLLLCDDVLGSLQVRAEVDRFFQRAKERLDDDPKLAIILLSSNEGIQKLLLDPTTYGAVLQLNALPHCSKDELALCLSDILRRAQAAPSGSQDLVTFTSKMMESNTVATLSENPVLVQSLISVVTSTVPARYAFSLRFWDLLLCEVKCEGGVERNLTEVLRSAGFMKSVVQKLDLEASGAFRDFALAHSPVLSREDHSKLVSWVASALPGAAPFVPYWFPGRLALLQALKAIDRPFVDKMMAVTLKNCEFSLQELKAEAATAEPEEKSAELTNGQGPSLEQLLGDGKITESVYQKEKEKEREEKEKEREREEKEKERKIAATRERLKDNSVTGKRRAELEEILDALEIGI